MEQLHVFIRKHNNNYHELALQPHCICDHPQEIRPSSHLVMIVKIPVLKVVISVTSFCSC